MTGQGEDGHPPRHHGVGMPDENTPLLPDREAALDGAHVYAHVGAGAGAGADAVAVADTDAEADADGAAAAGGASSTSSTSELWLLTTYSLPLIATYLLQYSFFVITTIVAGHLGPDDLAAASIGVTTMNVVGLAIFEGMATALDTLCAQAYGAGHRTGVGLHVQRMLVLMALAAVPIALFWVLSPQLLSFVVPYSLAARAGAFLRYSLVGLPGYGAFEALKRFTQAQGDTRAGMVALIVCAPVNAVLSWGLAFPLGMGLEGAALGAALSNNLRFLLLLGYLVSPWGRWSHACWGGFSREALARWGPMLSLSLAGVTATLAEWGAFEILTLSTSFISTNHLAAQTILTTATVIVWHVPFSISVAVSTRLGHLIGAGLLPTARRAVHLYSVVFAVVGVFDAAVLFLFRHQIPLLFSNDAAIREITSHCFVTVAIFQVVDSIVCGTNGMMRGLGRQDVAAWVVCIVNYAGAVPFAIWLELGPWSWGLDGVWIGFAIGQVATILLEGTYMRWLDWQKCVDRVKAREDM